MAKRARKAPKQEKSDSRWITVTSPFNYQWPGRSAVTHWSERDLGEHRVKNEVADFAVANGYAREGKTEEQNDAADAGTEAGVGDADAADADRSPDRPAVDSADG